MDQQKKTLLPLYILFFFSGLAGLIHQILWMGKLHLILGATVLSVSVVVASYMAGLAWGSAFWGKYGEKQKAPLRLYGWMEGAIGIYALLIPLIFQAVEKIRYSLFASLSASWGLGFWGELLATSILSMAVLVVPTFLMGGTLPVLARLATREKSVSALYTINTLGGALGVMLSGFLLIPFLGLSRSILLAGSTNILIGVVALLWHRKSPATVPPAENASEEDAGGSPLLVLVFCTGFASLLLEVCWARVMALLLGSSIYGSTLMVGVFLLGLGGGAWLGTIFLEKKKSLEKGIVVLLFFSMVTSALTVLLYSRLPYLFLLWFGSLRTEPGLLIPLKFLLTGIVILPIALTMGGIFPLILKIYLKEKSSFSRSTGRLYASNTLGAILGALLAGFLFIGLWGIKTTILLASFILGLTALFCLAVFSLSPIFRRTALGFTMAFLLYLVVTPPQWEKKLMVSGTSYYASNYKAKPNSNFSTFQKDLDANIDLLYYREGLYFTVSVEKHKLHHTIFIKNDGKVEGGIPTGTGKSRADMSTQMLLAYLPLIFKDNPKEALVIGLGSGVTAGAVLAHPSIHLDCVEIEEAVVEAVQTVPQFAPYLRNLFSDNKRVSLYMTDGRSFLNRPGKTYDVIISQPSDPWISGSAGLFTQEFFTLASRRLAPKGLFCQWIQLYHLSPDLFKSLVKTFAKVFPHSYIFKPYSAQEVLLLGSKTPFKLKYSLLKKAFGNGEIRKDLEKAGIKHPLGLYLLCLMGPKDIGPFVGDKTINTDDNRWIETRAPLFRYSGREGKEIFDEILRRGSDLSSYIDLPPKKNVEILAQLSAYMAFLQRPNYGLPLAKRAFRESKKTTYKKLMGDLYFLMGKNKKALQCWRAVLKENPQHYGALFSLGCYFSVQGQMKKAKKIFGKISNLSNEAKYFFSLQTQAIYGDERQLEKLKNTCRQVVLARCKAYLKPLSSRIRPPKKDPVKNLMLLFRETLHFLKKGDIPSSILLLEDLKKRAPHHWQTSFLNGLFFVQIGQFKKGLPLVQKGALLPQAPREYLLLLSKAYQKAGYPLQAKKAYWKYGRSQQFFSSPGDPARVEFFRFLGDYRRAFREMVYLIDQCKRGGKDPDPLYFRLREICAEELKICYAFMDRRKGIRGGLLLEDSLDLAFPAIRRKVEEQFEWAVVAYSQFRLGKTPHRFQVLQELRGLFEQAREKLHPSPSRERTYLHYTAILIRLGFLSEAQTVLQKFLKKHPNQAMAIFYLAQLREKEGKKRLASKLYRQVINSRAPFAYKMEAGKALVRLGE